MTVNFIKEYNGQLEFALASMSSRRVIEELTKHFGIFPKFKVIISKDEVKNHKPDPEIYLDVAKKLNLLPDECIVIEDTIVGVQAVVNANIHCFVLLNGFNSKRDFGDIKVDGFIESKEDLLKVTQST